MNNPSNRDDLIDSRDVIARIEELETDIESIDETERAELAILRALAEDAEGYAPDWHHGETLIRDSYFEDYARDLADDICDLRSYSWPFDCIDWSQAAAELRADYTAVEFDSVTYWIRS